MFRAGENDEQNGIQLCRILAHLPPRAQPAIMSCACGLAALALLFATGSLWWIAFGLFASYAFAWAGHFKVENNVPLTFKHPIWSLAADYRMFFLWVDGRLGAHLAAAGVGAKR
jgi:hypothetical protein